MPGAHQIEDAGAVREAELGQGLQGARLRFSTREHQVARTREAGCLLEQLGVVALDAFQVVQKLPTKDVRVGRAQEGGDTLDTLRVARDQVGLLVADHLKTMFQSA